MTPSLLVSVLLAGGRVAHAQCIEAQAFAPDATPGHVFGYHVAISGDTALLCAVGADTEAGEDAGAAYVLVRDAQGIWTQPSRLVRDDAAAGDQFGYFGAISGDTAIVGANWDDTSAGSNAGSAYVFVRDGDSWTQQAKLLASDGAASDLFGVSVAILGDTAVVGAPGDDTVAGANAGSVYVFERAGGVWTQQAHLFASDAASGDFLSGFSMVLDGDTLVVGAIYDNHPGATDAGSAYVFVRSNGAWSQQAKLTASDFAAFDYFGGSVSISGDTLIVGADSDNTAAGTDAGSAYVFVRNAGAWTQQAHLYASSPNAGDRFGFSVTVSGDTAAVGAIYDTTPAGSLTGSVETFVRSGGVWTLQTRIHTNAGQPNGEFGHAVALSGNILVTGAWLEDTMAGIDGGATYFHNLGCLPGDLNCDLIVNSNDVPHFIDALLSTGSFSGCDIRRADMNFDGQIDGSDMQSFVHAMPGF